VVSSLLTLSEYHRPALVAFGVLRRNEFSIRLSRGFVTETSTR